MGSWAPFVQETGQDREVFDLSHLNEKIQKYVWAQTGSNAEKVFHARTNYSCHCFTRREIPGDPIDQRYTDNGCCTRNENRVFDERRYELSKELPRIMENLVGAPCYHTDRGNLLNVAILNREREVIRLRIYFAVSKLSVRGMLDMIVQSAFPNDGDGPVPLPPGNKKIRFEVVLQRIMAGKKAFPTSR